MTDHIIKVIKNTPAVFDNQGRFSPENLTRDFTIFIEQPDNKETKGESRKQFVPQAQKLLNKAKADVSAAEGSDVVISSTSYAL